METPQDSRQSFQRPQNLGAEEDQEQPRGGNAVLSGAGEEGGEAKGLVVSGLAQGGLDQGELAEGEVAEDKGAQEEPAQPSLTQRAAGVGEEGDEKEVMEGRRDGHAACGPENDMINQEGDQGNRDQPQPQPLARIPVLIRNDFDEQAGNFLGPQRNRHSRFTHSQLRDLERLFQETRFPSLRVRRDLARYMGVDESDVQDWFKMRRSLFRRQSRLMMFCEKPLNRQNNSP